MISPSLVLRVRMQLDIQIEKTVCNDGCDGAVSTGREKKAGGGGGGGAVAGPHLVIEIVREQHQHLHCCDVHLQQ